MANELEVLLDPDVLTERYVQSANREFPLTKEWFDSGSPGQERAETYSYLYYPAMTEPAPMNVRGGPARVLVAGTASRRLASCYTQFNKMQLDMDAYTALRNPDNRELQLKGIDSVTRAYEDFGDRHKITKELIIAKSLTKGEVYIDNVSGAVLEASAATATTVDLGVPAANKTTVNGAIPANAKWSVATTKIGDQLDVIRHAAAQANREKPTDIWLNDINKKHLRNNDQFVEWAVQNPVLADAVLRGEVPMNLWGFNWHFVSGSYKDSSGATKDFFPTDIAVITPPASGKWVKRTNHLTLVPNSIGLKGGLPEAMSSIDEKFGPYSYAKVKDDPVMVELYMGDKFGFQFADPAAIYIATAFTVTS